MKRLCIVLILFSLSSIYADSNYGIKIGTNFSKFRSIETKAKPGTTLCFYKNNPVNTYFSINLELMYSAKKGEMNDVILGGTYTGAIFSHNINYSIGVIEFPLLLKNHYQINKKIGFNLYAGPSFSTRIFYMSKTNRQEFLFEIHDMDDWSYVKYDYDYILEMGNPAFEHGLSIHGGFSISVHHFLLDFRYMYDFYEIQTVGKADIDDEEMHSYLILLGYEF